MSLVISDKILRASGLSEADLLLEIIVLLFQQEKLSLGKVSEILGMPQICFQRLLADAASVFIMMLPIFKMTGELGDAADYVDWAGFYEMVQPQPVAS